MTRPEVQKVYSGDKTKEKTHFNAIITGIYWIYRPRNIYYGKPLSERIKIVNDNYLKTFSTTWDVLVKIPGVTQMVDCFIDLSWTLNDNAFESLRNDYHALINVNNAIPAGKEVVISKDVDVFCDDDKVHRTSVETKVIIPTFDEKIKLWEMYSKFSKILKDVQANLKLEDEERAKLGEGVYLYDDPEKNKAT